MKQLLLPAYRVYQRLSRASKRWVFGGVDALIFVVSVYISFSLRFDSWLSIEPLVRYGRVILLLIPLKLCVFYLVGVYRPILRYTGLEFLSLVFRAVTISSGIVVFIGFFFRIGQFPRSVLINDAVLTYVLIIGARLAVRWLVYQVVAIEGAKNRAKPVAIYGAGSAGAQLLQALSRDTQYQVVAFIDDDPQLYRQTIHGISVYSPERVEKLISNHAVKTVLLAIPSGSRKDRLRIVNQLKQYSLAVKTVPRVGEIVSGQVSISELRNIDITDLLGRDEVLPNLELLKKNITGKVVMITGAGGSIGSELCRQIVLQEPASLILYEWNEWALYQIHQELLSEHKSLDILPYLASTTDSKSLEEVMKSYQVQTIYHAAAYKHVPLVEMNPYQGVWNNVQGTLLCAQSAMAAEVETFVLVSTDKAVRPANVMGASKRVAEMVLQALSEKGEGKTKLMMVRFGNVLDSNGSVVPLFRKQLAEGRSLTVTHPEMTRYFMSIPEAARLVIQAGAMGNGGDVFLLDMGEPVKIKDLAKQMIELSGLSESEVDIQVTGLRPGEKMYEELLIDHHKSTPTEHPKIFSANEDFMSWQSLEPLLSKLLTASQQHEGSLIELLKQIVPEFKADS